MRAPTGPECALPHTRQGLKDNEAAGVNRSLVPCAPPWRLPSACPSTRQYAQRTKVCWDRAWPDPLPQPDDAAMTARVAMCSPASSVGPAGWRRGCGSPLSLAPCAPPWRLLGACPSTKQNAQRTKVCKTGRCLNLAVRPLLPDRESPRQMTPGRRLAAWRWRPSSANPG